MNSIFYIFFSSHYENNIVSILLVILLISCHKKEEAPVPIDSNKTSKIQRRLCFRALGVVSDWAANQGYHKLDSVLVFRL
jgi:hypothetical protein